MGVMTALVHLAAALAKRGHQVEVWQLSSWLETASRELLDKLTYAGVELVAVQIRSPWRLGKPAVEAIASRHPDLVHLHSVFSPPNNLIARRLNVPYVVSPHGGYAPEVLDRHAIRKRVFKRPFEASMLAKAAQVLALTDVEADEIRRFGVSTSISVIGNGAERPIADLRSDVFRRELGIGPSLLALFVGRLDLYQKRVDELVRGIGQTPRWHLALIGPDFRGGARRLRTIALRSHARDRVHFVGERYGRSLSEAFAAADLFTLPSRWEGYPMALLEALAHGTPALVSPEVERRLGVAAAGAAWVIDPREVAGTLGEAAQQNAAGWKARRAAASAFVEGRDWDTIAARYEAVYSQLLSKAAQKAS